MQSQKLTVLFRHYLHNVQNMQKVQSANSHLRITTGTRLVAKARKYRRPEDLEDPNYYGIGPKKEVTSAVQSIVARGFAKEQPSYKPPDDVEEKLQKICQKILGPSSSSSWTEQPLNDPLLKFKVLKKCMDTFQKNIPNSFLHSMGTVKDLLAFFSTPIEGCHPYDALLREGDKLPPNLHLMREGTRFNPLSDTFFDGITAYPGRKRILHTKSGEKFEKVIEWPHI